MSIVKVHTNPDVFEIKVPFLNVSTSATNCYVVKDGDDVLVVDTGAPSDEGRVLLDAALTELEVDRSRAKYFLTHLHLDHAGLVDDIVPAGATLYLSEVDFLGARASREAAHYDWAHNTFRRAGLSAHEVSSFARFALEPPLFSADRLHVVFVHEDDEISVGRFNFRVVETPGHTPGHLALFEPESRILFGGDHVLFVISPGIALFPDGSDGLQVYRDSLKKVQALDCTYLLVSHGEPRHDLAERIGWLDQHHGERLDETVLIIADEPGLSGEAVIKRIRWNVQGKAWDDVAFAQRWCIVSQGIVILNHLVDCGRIRRVLTDEGVYLYFPHEELKS